jgi:hypothetical protein
VKNIINIYFFIALTIAGVLFFLSLQLRNQPVYKFLQITRQAYRGENLSEIYSDDYLITIKRHYFYPSNHLDDSIQVEKIPRDSIFLISLQQIVFAGIHESNQFPTVNSVKGDDIVCRLHVKARKNFDIVIRLKKRNSSYIFSEISNLNLFLDYYPDSRKAFAKFVATHSTDRNLN